jgi:hypothetical protein
MQGTRGSAIRGENTLLIVKSARAPKFACKIKGAIVKNNGNDKPRNFACKDKDVRRDQPQISININAENTGRFANRRGGPMGAKFGWGGATADALPPCGGGLGGGVEPRAPRCHISRPPPPTPPHKGRGGIRGTVRPNLAPMGAALGAALVAALLPCKGRPYERPAVRSQGQTKARRGFPAGHTS